MEYVLLRSHSEDSQEEGKDIDEENSAVGEAKVQVASISDPKLGKIAVYAIPLKASIPSWLRNSNSRIFHAVNGQVQYKQTRGHLSQKCRLPALKDRVVIVVDSSGLNFSAHNEVWKGDREHVRSTAFGEKYLEYVTEAIKNSEALKKLQKEIAEEELKRVSKMETDTLFQQLVNSDKNLSLLLSNENPTIHLSSASKSSSSGMEPSEFEGKYSPTFIKLEEKHKKAAIEIPLNGTRPIAAKTDAQNEYLIRPDNRGEVQLPQNLRDSFQIREQLIDGRLTLYLRPKEEVVAIGTKYKFSIALYDDSMADSVRSEEVNVKIKEATAPPVKPKCPNPKPKPKPKNKGKGKGKGKAQNPPTLGLPPCTILTNDGRAIKDEPTEKWPEDMNFDEIDGGIIEDLGDDKIVYKINWDNSYHLQYRKQAKGRVAEEVVTEKYILGMRVLMLGLEQAYRQIKAKLKEDESAAGLPEYVDIFRRMASQGAASTVLALAQNLPKIVDKSSITEEDA